MSNPYSYFSSGNEELTGTVFATDYGVKYFLYFTEGGGYFPDYPEFNNQIFMFGFKPAQNLKRNDPSVKDTTLHFLTQYFKSKPETALIFVCDTADKRQDARYKMFDNWFKENLKISSEDPIIQKTDISFCDEDNTHCAHASLLVSINNPKITDITQAFQELGHNFKAKYETD